MRAAVLAAIGAFLISLTLLLAGVVTCGCAALSPAEEAAVASDAVAMSACAARAHVCKLGHADAGLGPCWTEFDACMAPYTDGGR